MVVESDVAMQDVFRQGFKRAGYRVLVTADPVQGGGAGSAQDPSVADCVIFNAQQIGESALEMFNELGEDERTQSIPAMLLLGRVPDTRGSRRLSTAQHRLVLPMPITMKQLRTTLAELAPTKVKVAGNSSLALPS